MCGLPLESQARLPEIKYERITEPAVHDQYPVEDFLPPMLLSSSMSNFERAERIITELEHQFELRFIAYYTFAYKSLSAWREERYAGLLCRTSGPTQGLFLAVNLYNNEEVLPHWMITFIRALARLHVQNVHISIYENGSQDRTKELIGLMAFAFRAMGVASITVRTSDLGSDYACMSDEQVIIPVVVGC